MSYSETLEQLLERAHKRGYGGMTLHRLVELAYESGRHDGWYDAFKKMNEKHDTKSK